MRTLAKVLRTCFCSLGVKGTKMKFERAKEATKKKDINVRYSKIEIKSIN